MEYGFISQVIVKRTLILHIFDMKFLFNRQKVDQLILPVLRKLSERATVRQTRISSYMISGAGSSSRCKSDKYKKKKPSKRMQAVLTNLKKKQNGPNLSESSSSDDENS